MGKSCNYVNEHLKETSKLKQKAKRKKRSSLDPSIERIVKKENTVNNDLDNTIYRALIIDSDKSNIQEIKCRRKLYKSVSLEDINAKAD